MTQNRSVRVGRTSHGYLITVVGQATMRESYALRQFFQRCDLDLARVVNFEQCDAVDSTFTGMLVKWKSDLGEDNLLLVADHGDMRRLFGAMHLENYFRTTDSPPAGVGDCVSLDVDRLTSHDFASHIYECHDRLAQLQGPHQAVFTKIVDQLEKELERS